LRWDADLASWALVGDADEYRVSNERQQLLQALQNAEALMSPKEIAEATDKTVGSVKVLLGEMVKAGQVANLSTASTAYPQLTLTLLTPLTLMAMKRARVRRVSTVRAHTIPPSPSFASMDTPKAKAATRATQTTLIVRRVAADERLRY
jgi:hypothetical protein